MFFNQHNEKLNKKPLDPLAEDVTHQRQLLFIQHLRGIKEIQQQGVRCKERLQVVKLLIRLVDQPFLFGGGKKRQGVLLGNFLS